MDRKDGSPTDALLAEAGWLRRLAGALVGDGADDIVQQTYLAAIVSPPVTGRPVRPWLALVLRNFARMRARGEKRAARAWEAAALEPAPPAPSPEQLLAQHEARRLVAAAVSALDEPYRTTVLLCYGEGLAPAEIATRLGIPAGTVRSRLKRGLDDIRARLDAEHGGHRSAWRAVLAPWAARDRGPEASGGGRGALSWAVASVGAGAVLVAAVLVIATSRGARDRPPPVALESAARLRISADAPSGRAPLPSTVNANPPPGDVRMTKQLNGFRNMAAAISVLAASSAAADELPREEAIKGCLEMREKVYACRQEFASQAVEQMVAAKGGPATPEERRKLYDAAIAKATKEGTGPAEPRRVLCRKILDFAAESGHAVTRSAAQTFVACFEKPDCDQRIRCYLAESAKVFPPAPTPAAKK